jgi:hypothetical protein
MAEAKGCPSPNVSKHSGVSDEMENLNCDNEDDEYIDDSALESPLVGGELICDKENFNTFTKELSSEQVGCNRSSDNMQDDLISVNAAPKHVVSREIFEKFVEFLVPVCILPQKLQEVERRRKLMEEGKGESVIIELISVVLNFC